MTSKSCQHLDIRIFDGVRCCLSCGNAIFDEEPPDILKSIAPSISVQGRPNYRYKNLNFELGQEIRLVVLQPDTEFDAPIQCSIAHANIGDPRQRNQYTAISYTWATGNVNGVDDSSRSRTVECLDGTILQVTISCEAALRQVRQWGIRHVWIDSICINQDNVRERNHQVGLMDRIYSEASNVHICIQDPTRDYRACFEWLKSNPVSPIYNFDLSDLKALSYLEPLLSLRWFSRVWVIQEIALSNIAFLVVNNARIILTADLLQQLRQSCEILGIPVPGPLRWTPGARETSDILRCLDSTRDCFSSDPRDKVYAVLSLVDPGFRELIPIDYAKDYEWIIILVARAAIAYYQNLEILKHVRSLPLEVQSGRRASWIPDWTQLPPTRVLPPQFTEETNDPWRGNISVIAEDELSDESLNLPTSYSQESADNQSSTVVKIFSPSTWAFPVLSVRAHFITLHSNFSILEDYVLGDILLDASLLAKTEYQWILPFFRRTNPRSRNRLNRWKSTRKCKLTEMHQKDALDFNLPDLIRFITDVTALEQKPRIFRADLSVGFTRADVRSGDCIFAIDGLSTPMTLRRVNSRDRYVVVGECYLWAALELDYWNEGSKKGIWGIRSPTFPHQEQTRTIEIE